MGTGLEPLLTALGEISDLGRARALLAWDERTQMPARGAAIRAEQLATLTRLRHELLAGDRLGRLIDAAGSELGSQPHDSLEASLVRVARREWEKARRVPAELRAETARVTSIAEHAWERAREQSDFTAFLPHLVRVIELQHRYVECFEADHPYDPLLDDYEPGMRTAELRPVLAALRDGALELVSEIGTSTAELDDSCLHGEFDLPAQTALAREVVAALPLEPGAWRLDPTVHPFAVGIGISDLRITTRFDPSYIGTGLWSVIHEVGHALYQNGIARELERTPLCRSASLGFDESQSRMWENWVGRGRPFIARLLELLRARFPARFGSLDAEALYRAANRVQPSLIRVEADEVTYNLHIVLRFELELELIEGRLAAADLPQAWAARMQDYFGLAVPDHAHGVLQDVHWAAGSFGYFPTYALGNVIAGQLWELAQAETAGLDRRLAAGDLEALRRLMAERVYRHGGKFEPAELIERVVGGPLDPAPLLGYLRAKFGELYGL
jgi:carboxypeptidase Taq